MKNTTYLFFRNLKILKKLIGYKQFKTLILTLNTHKSKQVVTSGRLKMSCEKPKVIVIGGGVSGLSAATALIGSGDKFDVTLLEASDRIGGRVQTVKFGDHMIENGAQWVHGEVDNAVFKMIEPLDLLDVQANHMKFNSDAAFVTQNGRILGADMHEKIVEMLEVLLEGPPEEGEASIPLGKWAHDTFWETAKDKYNVNGDLQVWESILDWIHRFQNSIDGSDTWHNVSCGGQNQYTKCEGNVTIAWKPPASYFSLIKYIVTNDKTPSLDLKLDLPSWIHLSSEVTKINYESPEKVQVLCKDGSVHLADHVICSVSLGVLKHCHTSLFSPVLPSIKQNAIEHLGINCVNKLHFEFSKKWWPHDLTGFNLLWCKDNNCERDIPNFWESEDPDVLNTVYDGFPLWTRALLGFYPVASHPLALNTWLTGPASKHVETLPENVVQTICIDVLRKFIGTKFDIPEPVNFTRSKWNSNPFTRGSYSYRKVSSEKNDVWASQLAVPIIGPEKKPIVCFAGEATHSHYYSTVHGAYETGQREARRLIDFYAA